MTTNRAGKRHIAPVPAVIVRFCAPFKRWQTYRLRFVAAAEAAPSVTAQSKLNCVVGRRDRPLKRRLLMYRPRNKSTAEGRLDHQVHYPAVTALYRKVHCCHKRICRTVQRNVVAAEAAIRSFTVTFPVKAEVAISSVNL